MFHELRFQSEHAAMAVSESAERENNFVENIKILTMGPDDPEGPALPASPYKIIKTSIQQEWWGGGREENRGKTDTKEIKQG